MLDETNITVMSNSSDPEVITQTLLQMIAEWLKEEGAYTTPVQQQMLASHLKAMVLRDSTGERLPDFDLSLFDEISPESLQLAKRVVNCFHQLPPEEALLLSVHFEVARSNT